MEQLKKISYEVISDTRKYQSYEGNLTLVKVLFVLMGVCLLYCASYHLLGFYIKYIVFIILNIGMIAYALFGKGVKSNGNLTLRKIFLILAGIYILYYAPYKILKDFYLLEYFDYFDDFYAEDLFFIALIAGLIASVLLSKNTKNWLLTFYFAIIVVLQFFYGAFYRIFTSAYPNWFNIATCIIMVLFLARLSKITKIEFFKISSLIFMGLGISLLIELPTSLGSLLMELGTDRYLPMQYFFQSVLLLFAVFFTLGTLMMKKERMSF